MCRVDGVAGCCHCCGRRGWCCCNGASAGTRGGDVVGAEEAGVAGLGGRWVCKVACC